MLLLEEISNEVVANHWQKVRVAHRTVLGLRNVDFFLVIVDLLVHFFVFFGCFLQLFFLSLELLEQCVFMQHAGPRVSLAPLEPAKFVNALSVHQNES